MRTIACAIIVFGIIAVCTWQAYRGMVDTINNQRGRIAELTTQVQNLREALK